MRPVHEEYDVTGAGAGAGVDAGAASARSFYLLEESMCVIGETGYVRPYATVDELRARLEPKLAFVESCGSPVNDLLLGESVNVWTVQRGRLVAGLDVTEFVGVHLTSGARATVFELNRHREAFTSGRRADPPPADEGARLSLDWDGIVAGLPPLEAPLASPGDEALAVRLDGPHPAPDLSSYIDGLLAELAEADRPEWSESLDYGSPFTL
ncbi:hypothetical protein AB0E10_06160 [Streptomyces sp. NPDC048045]|uniref:hypothetical protein n=1 Tax=Streptomyces sp. NPDC048045 TaxID=3154710 RepID=UPI00341CF9AA